MFGLAEAIDRLRDEAIGELPASVLGGDIIELTTAINRLEGERLRRVALFGKRGDMMADGAFSVIAWLRWKCRLRGARAQALSEVAQRLVELPATAGALASGAISLDHASVIASCAADVGSDAMVKGEPILLEAAMELDPQLLRVAADHIRHAVSPEGAIDDANEAHSARRLWLSRVGQMYRIDGQLDVEGGAILSTAIAAIMGAPARDDGRSAAQQRADALVALGRRQLDGGNLPVVAGQKPHLSLLVREQTLRGEEGAEAAEMERAGAVTGEAARRLACDCSLTEVTIDSEGVPVEAGRARRTVSGSQRRALVARDRHCRFPGCDAPADWTDAHHLQHWILGGPTVLWNLVLLCGRHHRLVHEGRWRLQSQRGELVAVPPWAA